MQADPVLTPKPRLPRVVARVGRLRYLNLLAATVVSAFVVLLLLCLLLRSHRGGIHLFIVWLGVGLVIWQQVAAAIVSVWRLHDLGRSGAWALLWLVPYGGVVTTVYLLIAPGNAMPNRFGPAPALPGKLDKGLAAIVMVSMVAIAGASWWWGPVTVLGPVIDGFLALDR
ncbi:DUF805 domain-containing protein [Pseudoduganella chitinolytica]|uniref:DUF805 domain-containing protein n=1 Tax=Pseudoduganella chitinolytica TaxID=34070 RepID=A0ABY8B9U8_9BURK|nr:DUF805 domain-containing protein [Pseudoduganella chitinolytica]WEF32699.1 DUF805 domain-containing protein [Pseudoduganella chitinolytica]